jgi:ribonucleoside-diphosphate reductase alpha chain
MKKEDTPMKLEFPVNVIKNSGRVEEFDSSKIFEAVMKAIKGAVIDVEETFDEAKSAATAMTVTRNAVSALLRTCEAPRREGVDFSVDTIHTEVERALVAEDFDAGRAYISHRDVKRQGRRPIPVEVREAFDESAKYFKTQLQQFQFYNKYSRFNQDKGRRETWPETVDRVVSYLKELSENQKPGAVSAATFEEIRTAILELRVMPSMRMIAMAGPAARRNNISFYNCSYRGVDHPYFLIEALIISMCGCGVGFSVEDKFVSRLPEVSSSWKPEADGTWSDSRLWGEDAPVRRCVRTTDPNSVSITHVVEDTSEGWADAFWAGVVHWWNGCDTIEFDFSEVRPAGTVLKTKGGTSSGPAPLRRMLEFVRNKLLSAKGGKLGTVTAHDLMCMVGDCVVQGGVRRSAMISGFDWEDGDMRKAKSGAWYRPEAAPWRRNANNSCVWPDRKLSDDEVETFMRDMDASMAGEPGIFSRRNSLRMMPKRRYDALTDKERDEIFTNPCGEIVLLSGEFCNLSIAVARPGMSVSDMEQAVRLATIIGTIQSTGIHFPGLRDSWTENCRKERLLGVDITGQADVDFLDEETLAFLKDVCVETNKEVARNLDIPQSAATTCVKPSGNSSVLLDCAPGLNRRWAPFNIRRTELSSHGVMAKVLKSAGAIIEPKFGQTEPDVATYVSTWVTRTPDPSIPTTRDRCAIAQCDVWKKNKLFWTEHNPSVTITYRRDEVDELIEWVKENQEIVGGMAFLPADESDTVYEQAPYETIDEERYNDLLSQIPEIDFALLYAYEDRDTTTSAQELACVGGACALDF